eukprot:7307980-Ditylum_brightwellii.AAC.1
MSLTSRQSKFCNKRTEKWNIKCNERDSQWIGGKQLWIGATGSIHYQEETGIVKQQKKLTAYTANYYPNVKLKMI